MKLRAKILSGFFILVSMLTIAGIWSITELTHLGSSVKQLLDENYKSINSSKMMIEALERQDSGILLLLLGKGNEGNQIINSGDSLFAEGFEIASNNITIPTEKEIIEEIKSKYALFSSYLENPIIISEKQSRINWYFSNPHKYFNEVKLAVDLLMNLNDKTMFETASALQNKSNRAVMPGIVSILAAIVFSLIFTYLVDYYFIGPVVKMTKSVRDFVDHSIPYMVKIESQDELNELSQSIDTLCQITKSAHGR
jgi:hypothetical protein